MRRQRSLQVTPRDDILRPRLPALKAAHPCWGYRRLWAYLRCVEQREVKKKRILRLLREHHLLVPPHLRLKAKRPVSGSQPRPSKPQAWGGLDLTKVLVEGCGWMSIVLGLDGYTTNIVGDDAGSPCPAKHWLAALDMAVNRQCPDGARGQGWSLMSDNGSQPTSLACMPACATLGIHQAFTSYHNPQGHAATARVIRTLKEACLWLREWTSPFMRIRAFEDGITADNEHYRHASLGYNTPSQFAREYYSRHRPPFVAA